MYGPLSFASPVATFDETPPGAVLVTGEFVQLGNKLNGEITPPSLDADNTGLTGLKKITSVTIATPPGVENDPFLGVSTMPQALALPGAVAKHETATDADAGVARPWSVDVVNAGMWNWIAFAADDEA